MIQKSLYPILLSTLFFLLTVTISCKREVEIALPVPQVEGAPSTASMSIQVQSMQGGDATISVDLYVINKNGRFVTGLSKSAFSIPATSSYNYEITDVKLQSLQQKSGGYSALMLFDQSGSILTTDRQNLRIEAGKIFLSHLGREDNAAVASFASASSNYPVGLYPNYTKYHNQFSQDTVYMKAVLDTLQRTVSGGTPLYRSIYEALDFASTKAKNANKAVIVFTDGQDTDGGKNINDVVNFAKERSLPLFTVGLSRSVDVQVLSRMANETNGGFFWAQDAKQLISSFSTLGRLLSGSTHLYRTTWTVKNKLREWRTGDVVSATIRITTPTGEIIESPFWVRL